MVLLSRVLLGMVDLEEQREWIEIVTQMSMMEKAVQEDQVELVETITWAPMLETEVLGEELVDREARATALLLRQVEHLVPWALLLSLVARTMLVLQTRPLRLHRQVHKQAPSRCTGRSSSWGQVGVPVATGGAVQSSGTGMPVFTGDAASIGISTGLMLAVPSVMLAL